MKGIIYLDSIYYSLEVDFYTDVLLKLKHPEAKSDDLSTIVSSAVQHALPILNSCTKDRCGFLFVRYKRHCCTELVSWEHAACPLSGIKKCPLVGG